MSRLVKGFVLGVTAALIFVAVTTLFEGSDRSLWWWPAVLVSGAIGGGVIGALFGAESEGEAPEERYDGTDAKSGDSAVESGNP
jgi:hypothetical protein